MKKVWAILLTLCLAMGTYGAYAEALTPGTYTSTMNAMHGPMTVEVAVTEDAITDVNVVDQVETPGVTDPVFENIPAAIVANQTAEVDTITGATISSRTLIAAVKDCLKQAGDTEGAFSKPIEKEPAQDVTVTAGCDHRWWRAEQVWPRRSARPMKGASVIVIEKTGFLGGNSIVAGRHLQRTRSGASGSCADFRRSGFPRAGRAG